MRKLERNAIFEESVIILLILFKLKSNNNSFASKNFIIFFPYLKFKNFFSIQFFKNLMFLTTFQQKYFKKYYFLKFWRYKKLAHKIGTTVYENRLSKLTLRNIYKVYKKFSFYKVKKHVFKILKLKQVYINNLYFNNLQSLLHFRYLYNKYFLKENNFQINKPTSLRIGGGILKYSNVISKKYINYKINKRCLITTNKRKANYWSKLPRLYSSFLKLKKKGVYKRLYYDLSTRKKYYYPDKSVNKILLNYIKWLYKPYTKKFKIWKKYRRGTLKIFKCKSLLLRLSKILYLKQIIKKFNVNRMSFCLIFQNIKLLLRKIKKYKKKIGFRSVKFNKYLLKKIIFNKSLFFYKKFYLFYKKFYLFYLYIFNKIKKKIFILINFLNFKLNYIKIFSYINLTLNVIYKNFYYICFIKKTTSNLFITITNRLGEVLLSYSAGYIFELKKKKKRKSTKVLTFLIKKISKSLRLKNIFVLKKLYIQSKLKNIIKMVFFEFLKYSITIKTLNYINNRSHGQGRRLKKLRRI